MNGQDRIITVRNDTVECRILSISPTHLNYEQRSGKRIVGKFIPVSEVAEYYRASGSRDVKFRHWQAGIGFGGSYLTASTVEPENILVMETGMPRDKAEDYYRKYRTGMQVNARIHYLFDVGSDILDIGTGLKYRLSSFSSQTDLVLETYQPYVYTPFSINEKVYINYLGAPFIMQLWLGQNHRFRLAGEISAGYVHFRGEARFKGLQRNLLATGNTFGGNAGIIFAYCPLDYMSVNIDANYFSAVLKRVKFSDGIVSETVNLEKNNYENLSHLNCSFGIRFHF
jgi:hypothetical protein